MKIGRLVVESHSDGTVSLILYLVPNHYFMKCRKLGCKKCQGYPFSHKIKTRT